MTELTVTIKTSECTYKQKFLLYEQYQMTIMDPIVKQCVDEAKNNIKNDDLEIEDIKVRSLLVIK